MRGGILISCVFLAVAIAGCDRHADIDAPGRHAGGRYQGIGIYPADALWSRLAGNYSMKDRTRALRADDGQIIVVVDSRTGEIRQCGNLSGYCVTMNPWSAPLGSDRSAPLGLSKHAADLANGTANSTDAEAANLNATEKQP
jgi:hypothetical protein